MRQLHGLVAAGNTVIVVEHDMPVAAASDWIIDIGPGAGDEGGRVVAAGTPAQVAKGAESRTANILQLFCDEGAAPRLGKPRSLQNAPSERCVPNVLR
jgi:excinuclease UvrABC ATPase subunit